jgi:type II secretory pathway component PulK
MRIARHIPLGVPPSRRRVRPVTRHSPPVTRESGIALIVVMIAILVLSLLAWKFAQFMKVELTLARNANSEAELEWIGRSGVEYSKWVLAGNCEPFDSLNQRWAGGSSDRCTNSPIPEAEVALGHGSFTWKITDLESKANINMCVAPGGDRLLQQALVMAGVDAGELPSLTGAIIDWIDADNNTHLDGAESDYYHGLNPPYDAKNGPIDDMSELLLVKGVTPEIYWGPNSTNHQAGIIQQQLTQQAGRFGSQNPNDVQQNPVGLVDLFAPISTGRINVNTASAEVLQLIPGIDAVMAKAIVDGRQGEDDGSGLLGPYPTVEAVRRIPEVSPMALNSIRQFCTHESRNFQVEIDAKIDNYSRKFVAIIHRNDRRNPRDIQTLTFYWK